MGVCVHIYIYIFIYIYIYTYIHMCVCVCVYICMCVCVFLRLTYITPQPGSPPMAVSALERLRTTEIQWLFSPQSWVPQQSQPGVEGPEDYWRATGHLQATLETRKGQLVISAKEC